MSVQGEGEIDDAGHSLAEKKHVVREQIGVNDAYRQILRPDVALEMIELSAEKIGQPMLPPRRRGERPVRTADASRARKARCRGTSEKSAPARCICASASPTPAQCATFGFRGQIPSRKLMIAAGRPASVPEHLAALVLQRLRARDAARGEVSHQAKKKRQVAFCDALLVQRQDEISG